jgi:hypothetical protein
MQCPSRCDFTVFNAVASCNYELGRALDPVFQIRTDFNINIKINFRSRISYPGLRSSPSSHLVITFRVKAPFNIREIIMESLPPPLPRVTIQFCTQCKWMLRAAYVSSIQFPKSNFCHRKISSFKLFQPQQAFPARHVSELRFGDSGVHAGLPMQMHRKIRLWWPVLLCSRTFDGYEPCESV